MSPSDTPENQPDDDTEKANLRKKRRQNLLEEAKQEAIKAVGNMQPKGKPNPKAPPKVVEVAPIAKSARMRGRHWGLILSFLIFVLAPIAVSTWYLWERAVDQYASTTAFTVRQEQGGGATDLLTGFAAQIGGGGGSPDTAILYEYIRSQRIVSQINEDFDLVSHYSAYRDQDPIFSLAPDPTLEDLVAYWQKVVTVSYDEGSGLMELRVQAFDAETAQTIAQAVLSRSQDVINGLNDQLRSDTLRYAEADLLDAEERVRNARAELTLFRTRTQLIDPETDLAGRLGVVNTLQQQLAEAFIAYDLLLLTTNENDPRVQQAGQRIDVIRDRMAEERANVAGGDGTTATGEDYPSLLAEYEGLLVDREFAEESYRASLAALDIARANAIRQSRYLAAFIEPTLPQTAEYPQRTTLLGLIALFLMLTWTICSLVFYSVRDSR